MHLRLPFTSTSRFRRRSIRVSSRVSRTSHKLFKNTRRVVAVASVLVLLMVVPLVIWQLRSPSQKVAAAWFDAGYGYRKKYPISNSSGSVQTDFQTQLTIDTATLVTAGKLLSSCNDMRFTDINGNLLSDWVEPGTCNTASTLVWVKIPSIATSGVDIYFYYGNPSAVSISTTNSTFIRDMSGAAVNWPLDETSATQSYSRVVNPAVPVGRNMVIDPGFDDPTKWTAGTGWVVTGGLGVATAATSSNKLTQTLPVTLGKAYTITYDVAVTSGSVLFQAGNTGNGTIRTVTGTYTENIVWVTDTTLRFTPSATFTGSIDNVIVTQLSVPAMPNVAAPQLIADGDMEAGTTAAWTAVNGALLSKQGAAHGGTKVLRVTRNGTNGADARQTILTVGNIYRLTGYARSDSSATPVVQQGISSVFTGTTSTAWQPFDVVFVAGSTQLNFIASTSSDPQYAEFDDVTVSLDTSIRQGEIIQDGALEVWTNSTNLTNWTKAVNGTSTVNQETSIVHGGSSALRLDVDGSNSNVFISQLSVAIGKTYTATFWAKSDAAGQSMQVSNTAGTAFLIQTLTTTYTQYSVTFVATDTGFVLKRGTATSHSLYIDDVSVTENAPLVGIPVNGVVLASSTGAGGHLTNGYTFDGTNDAVNAYSSDLNSVFNPNEGTLVTWAKVSGSGVWTDGFAGGRYESAIQADSNNSLLVLRVTTDNTLRLRYAAGGTIKQVDITTSTTGWMQLVMTWSKSNDQLKVYFNGTQSGSTQTGLGTWSGNLSSTSVNIGAQTSTGTQPWSGMINDTRLYSRALSAAEISDQYNASSDIQAYTTSNFSGHELLRKFNTGVTVGAAATEEITPGPIGAWNFDEGTGATTHDSTASARNGTITGATWQTEDQCVSGKCLYFNGSNQKVSINDNDVFSVNTTNQFTAEVWFKPNNLATRQMVMGKGSGSNYEWEIRFETNGVLEAFLISPAGTTYMVATSVGNTIAPNQWYHAVLVSNLDTPVTSLYLNGRLNATTTSTSGTYANGTAPVRLGERADNTEDFTGFIDEPKIYNYARSATQIQVDYNAGAVQLGKKQQQTFLSNSLVAYYKLDENTGTSAADSSGNGFTGTLTNTPTWVQGKFGPGVNFAAASNQYITIPDTTGSALDITGSYTASAWVNPTSYANATNYVVVKGGQLYGFYISSSGKVTPVENAVAKTASTGSVATGTWTLVTVTYDSTKISIYINGVLDSTQNSTTTLTTNNNDLLISHSTTSADFDGVIDEVRVYNRALSAADVQSLYNWSTGPVGYWKLDEKSGTSASDISGSANTGTLTNSPSWSGGKYGAAVNLLQSNDYIDMGDTTSLRLTSAGTLEAWVNPASYPPSANWAVVANKGNWSGGRNDYTIYFQQTTSAIRFDINGASGTNAISVANTNAPLNTWTHLVLSWDGTTVRGYVNGVLVGSTSQTQTPDTSTYSFQIGAANTARSFDGKIDDVKVYNYARTTSQILEDMNSGQSGATAGPNVGVLPKPQGYWKFDEGSGTTTTNFGLAGTSFNGTLGNMASPATSTSGWSNTGKYNKGLSFDGADDYVSYTSTNLINPTSGSVSLWLNPGVTQSASAYAFAGRTSSNARVYIKVSTALAVNCQLGTGTTIGSVTLTAGVWSHVVCTWDNTKAAFYVNGKDVTTTSTITALTASVAATSYIGGFDNLGTQNFAGQMDEVKIYNAALTPEQVKLDYNEGSSINYGANIDQSSLLTDGTGNSPVAYWPFDEKSGLTSKDVTGLAHTMNAEVSPTWTTGKIGAAIQTTSRGFYTPDAADLDNTSAMTVEAWIYRTSQANFQRIVSKQFFNVTNLGSWLFYENNAGGLQFLTINNGGASQSLNGTSGVLALNQWQHVVATYDGSTARLYVNGVPAGTGAMTTAIADSAYCVTVGYSANTDCVSSVQNRFQGKIDDVKIYNYARTPAQVAYDYNRGKPSAWFKFDECQGGTAFDMSGNGNNGTINIGGTGSQTALGTCNTTGTAWGNGAVGKYSSSLNFDGTDDYINLATSLNLAQPFSLSAWIKVNGGSGVRGIIGNFNNSIRTGPVLFVTSAGKLDFADSGTVIGATTVTNNQWRHVLMTGSGTTVNLYVDGKLDGSGTVTLTANTTDNFLIGSYYNSNTPANFFNGQMDDVRVYNYALSQAQINQVYNEGSSVRYGPVSGSP